MELKITKQEKNALFDREDISFRITDVGVTSARLEVRDLIAASTGSAPDSVAIISISSEFGRNIVSGVAHIYKSKEDLERIEPKHIIKRMLPKQKKEKPKPAEETAKQVEEADGGASDSSDVGEAKLRGAARHEAAPAEEVKAEEKPAGEKKEGEEQ